MRRIRTLSPANKLRVAAELLDVGADRVAELVAELATAEITAARMVRGQESKT